MPVKPYWELHILPMFRLIDHDHMTRFFNLFDYDAVVTNQDDINDALHFNAMPPAATGGPWPEEWVALFKRWTEAGCPRLTSAKGVTYTLTVKGNGMLLTAAGTYATGDDAWFERLPDAGGLRVYSLAVRPGGGSGTSPFNVEEEGLPKGTKSVTVIDGDGSHTVTA